eukprot:388320-Heterocapsa_arctica.AAC.1
MPRGTKGANMERKDMGSIFKRKVLNCLRSMASSPASSLQTMSRPWHIQNSKKVKGKPKIMGRAFTAFSAAFGFSSLAEANKAAAAAPSVKAQKTFWTRGGSSAPFAAMMSTTKEAESEE